MGPTVPSATFGCSTPPPPPANIPLHPAPFLFRETMKPRFRMFLSVSIPYLQPPCHLPLFYLVSKKKVSSSKVSSSICVLNSTPPCPLKNLTLLLILFPVLYSQLPKPRIFIIVLNILQSHLKKSLLHSVTSSFVSLLFFTSCPNVLFLLPTRFSEGSNLDPAPTISPNGSCLDH